MSGKREGRGLPVGGAGLGRVPGGGAGGDAAAGRGQPRPAPRWAGNAPARRGACRERAVLPVPARRRQQHAARPWRTGTVRAAETAGNAARPAGRGGDRREGAWGAPAGRGPTGGEAPARGSGPPRRHVGQGRRRARPGGARVPRSGAVRPAGPRRGRLACRSRRFLCEEAAEEG